MRTAHHMKHVLNTRDMSHLNSSVRQSIYKTPHNDIFTFAYERIIQI